jgi:type I restriction enzyme M protein
MGKTSAIPAGLGWRSLLRLDGDALETHYRDILAELGKGSGLIPTIFRKTQNKIQDPAKLRRLIELAMTYLDVAYTLLTATGQPFHFEEIT